MKTALIILFGILFLNSYSQESKQIELRYVTTTTSYSDGTTKSRGKMEWKQKEDASWKDLGKKYSNIETVLSVSPEAIMHLQLAKDNRRYYNIAIPVTAVVSLGALFGTPYVIKQFKGPNENASPGLIGLAAQLVPFVACAVGGFAICNRYKNKSYDELKMACGIYNKSIDPEARVIDSMQWGLGFGSAPTQRTFPQLTFQLNLH